MDLKKIPDEVCGKCKNKKRRTKSLLQIIRSKLDAKELTRDKKILRETCMKIADFCAKSEDFSVADLSSLIKNLERSSMIVQKRKKLMVHESNKKPAPHSAKKQKK